MTVKFRSQSDPNRVHYTLEDGSGCSCKGYATHSHCWHVESAAYRVERRHNSRIGGYEYAIVSNVTGRVEGFRPSEADARADIREMVA